MTAERRRKVGKQIKLLIVLAISKEVVNKDMQAWFLRKRSGEDVFLVK